MKTQNIQDMKQQKKSTQSNDGQNQKTKKENVKGNRDTQSVMAEMKIRSDRPRKKK
jgi:hypothetical protein